MLSYPSDINFRTKIKSVGFAGTYVALNVIQFVFNANIYTKHYCHNSEDVALGIMVIVLI